MVVPAFDGFVGVESTPFYPQGPAKPSRGELLWGDGVFKTGATDGAHIEVRARARTGWIKASALDNGKSLLEVYFIDVGQGDGVLIKTPDFRHIMIDGGLPRENQNTGKNAADFVDWKFCKDYGFDFIELDAIIASHNDFDHYGGLSDMLDAAQQRELDAARVSVEAFYHAGISWWKDPGKTLGKTVVSQGKTYHVQLLEDRQAAAAATSGVGVQLQGEWGAFVKRVVAAKRADGQPTLVERLSDKSSHLPGFAPADGPTVIRVLAPIEFDVGGTPALAKVGGDSLTTNGNSVLLRLDYGRSRILLTGDLNKASQNSLMDAYSGRRLEFKCDVAKSCHHGSEDVSFSFLQAMEPAATVISSGDTEGHDHPRPRIVAASGVTGHLFIKDDEIVTPLVYSTELARSISLGHPTGLKLKAGAVEGQPADQEVEAANLQKAVVEYVENKPLGAPKPGQKPMSQTKVVAGLIYGLVNMRTDGNKILMATLNEGKGTWTVKSFKSRF